MQGSLEQVKVGDRIGLADGQHERIVTVERVTATQIIIGANRYNKKNGSLIGSTGWSRRFVFLPSPDHAEKIIKNMKIRNMQYSLEKLRITPENMNHFEALFAALDKDKDPK